MSRLGRLLFIIGFLCLPSAAHALSSNWLRDGSVDAVYSTGVFEHIDDPLRAGAEAARVPALTGGNARVGDVRAAFKRSKRMKRNEEIRRGNLRVRAPGGPPVVSTARLASLGAVPGAVFGEGGSGGGSGVGGRRT